MERSSIILQSPTFVKHFLDFFCSKIDFISLSSMTCLFFCFVFSVSIYRLALCHSYSLSPGIQKPLSSSLTILIVGEQGPRRAAGQNISSIQRLQAGCWVYLYLLPYMGKGGFRSGQATASVPLSPIQNLPPCTRAACLSFS